MKTTIFGLSLVTAVSGCPTRTIYYDAGAGEAGSSGTAGAGTNPMAGSGGGGAGSKQGTAGVGGGATAGAAGGNNVAGASGAPGGAGGSAGSDGTGGSGGGTSSCADTTTDPKNCGKCGHDCLGGACSASQCQPLLLGQFTGNPNNLSVAAQSVYVTTDIGYVARASKDGSDLKPFAMPAFTSTAFSGTPVVEDGSRVFFVWNGSPLRLAYCSASSCDSTITAIGGPDSQYFAVDAADHRVAWIDYSPSQFWVAPTTGTVTGTAVPGGTLADGSTGSRVLYAQGGLYFSIGQSIQRLPLSGGTQTTVGYTSTTTSSTALVVVAANASSLFFSDGSGIFFTPLPSGNGGAGTRLMDVTSRFAVDDTFAYWNNTSGIQACQLANCTATPRVVPGTVGATEIGTDDTAIYWTVSTFPPGQPSTDAFTLWKAAK